MDMLGEAEPKFEPLIVNVEPLAHGAFSGKIPVMLGLSNENRRTAVPTSELMAAA
jgi:hypothetical protein